VSNSSAFRLTGGAADKIRSKITTTDATDVAGSATAQTPVVWFQCNEVAGGTPNLTVAIYNAGTTTSTYLGDGTSAWVAKAMTANQSVTFGEGFVLEKNEFLRITISAGSVDVVGLALLNNELA
jgi:hypothetical protein